MKRLNQIAALVILSITFLLLNTVNVFAYQYVKTEGRTLVADFDEDGTYTQFRVEGVGYSPTPIGRHVSDWGYPDVNNPNPDNIYDDPAILDRDFQLLQDMNANAIRIWKGEDTQQGFRFSKQINSKNV